MDLKVVLNEKEEEGGGGGKTDSVRVYVIF